MCCCTLLAVLFTLQLTKVTSCKHIDPDDTNIIDIINPLEIPPIRTGMNIFFTKTVYVN